MLLSSLQISAPKRAAPQLVRESLMASRVSFLSSSFGFFRLGSPRSLEAISENRTRTFNVIYNFLEEILKIRRVNLKYGVVIYK